ncbi:Acyl-[acyl-carrier-protein]--UDP-N-acetylglucosamine O-acyltransferase [hydrothermal vent metagenome]|uniref:Acyl-[acyl-carrier-protein]--UDP-N-acetylglucosamine O-acyltransferase n=1 Tax=hydrothermal vent metagenome TaxID=652676 RepID=A0A3B0ZTU1_9ZZZZ
MNNIHSTAIVDPKAELGSGNTIGAYCVIEADVVLGNNNQLHTGAVLKNGCRIGNENIFYEYSVMAGLPQDVSFDKQASTLVEMGNNNEFREYTTVNRATLKENGVTKLGNHNYLMAHAHIGHDCVLADNIVMVISSGIAGHVHVGKGAFISGGVMVHQFVNIGQYAMIGGNAKITQDVLPFFMTDGIPAFVKGINVVGLKRAGFKKSDISDLKQAYRILFSSANSLEQIMAGLKDIKSSIIKELSVFLEQSKRGFHRTERDKASL